MPFSHHSHSGSFCLHAKDDLQDMVEAAIAKGMIVYCLTEHMPRTMEDLYPEEKCVITSLNWFEDNMRAFFAEATRLKELYKSQVDIRIGFESEWIRASSLELVKDMQSAMPFDFFVGSVHHVHAIPIDFDRKMYEKARTKAGGSDERLFEDYFDAQFEMLRATQPPIVGHFDLIRLMSDEPNGDVSRYQNVWKKVERNLDFVASYGGILEINSSAFRKGMTEPYPAVNICKLFLAKGGRFALSDDAHSVEQVGLNYQKSRAAIETVGITTLHYCRSGSSDVKRPSFTEILVKELDDHPCWKA